MGMVDSTSTVIAFCRRQTVDLPINRVDYDELVSELAERGSLFTQGA
jgi:hypothetical protein